MPAIEFTRRYAMAHRLLADPKSKCIVPHGHNEIVTVKLAPRTGFHFGAANAQAPFDALKQRWHSWIDGYVDHALQLNQADPLIAFFTEQEPARLPRIMTFFGDPTTEALATCFWLKLSAFLQVDSLPFDVAEVRVEETPTNAVILSRLNDDTCGLPTTVWPRRADMSINDL